jgi:DNA-binding NarL/FixJ family response regulator
MDSPFHFFKEPIKNPKLLIVEDEKLLRDAYELIFKKEKFAIKTAVDGRDALRSMRSFTPDIILLDMLMPNMNGIEFLQNTDIKRNIPHCKVIVLSNLSDRIRARDVAEYNVKRVLVKSDLSPDELVKVVKKLIA